MAAFKDKKCVPFVGYDLHMKNESVMLNDMIYMFQLIPYDSLVNVIKNYEIIS